MNHTPWILVSLSVIAVLLSGVASAGLDRIPVHSEPPSSVPDGPPAAPKTRAQIAAEAYAIEADVKANAGRKTDPSNDGTGATTDYSFTTTSDFDAGTKTNTETSSDICTQESSGAFGLRTGTDYIGISAACIAGARGPGTSGLLRSYDFHTLSSGKLKDFSGSGDDCTLSGSPPDSPGTYGGGMGFDGTDDKAVCSAPSTPTSYTLHALVYANTSGRLIVSFDSAGLTYLTYGLISANKFSCVSNHGGFGIIATESGSGHGGSWHDIDCVENASNSTINIYIDGVWSAKNTFTGSPGTWDQLHIGVYVTSLWYAGMIDELSLWSRALSGSELLNLATDGRNEYAASGSWKSVQQGSTAELFKTIRVDYSGATANLYITSTYLVDSTGLYFYIDNTDLTSGSSHTYTVSATDPNPWNVGQNLTGNGAGTVSVSAITVTTTGGVGTYTGCAPAPSGMTCTQNSTWDQSKVKLCGSQIFNVSTAHPALTLSVTNSKIDGCGLTGVFKTTDYLPSTGPAWDGVSGVSYTFQNSTFFNFTALIWHIDSDGNTNYDKGATVLRMENDTLSDFGGTLKYTQTSERIILKESQDLTVSEYNRDDDSSCVFSDHPLEGNPGDSFNSSALIRSRFTDSSEHDSGCVEGNVVRIVQDNYFEGGFLQVVYGSDFFHGQGQDRVTPTEMLNWSHNYANGSRHTVFGFYGTSTGSFANHFGKNEYATVYGNYVNNSRYIPFQFTGNQTGGRVIGNYMRGPVPWPISGPTFKYSILVGGRDHDFLVDHNYIWDSDVVQAAGIVVGFASYNVTVSNNVLYDVGANAIRVEGTIFKYKTASNGTEASDYSWRGTSITILKNYLSGGTHHQAISVDSGYTSMRNNSIVSGPISGDIFVKFSGTWLVWADWIDGYPDKPRVGFDPAIPGIGVPPSIPAAREEDFWVRSMRSGGMGFSGVGSAFINITSIVPEWGNLSARCVDPMRGYDLYNTPHTTTDSEVFRWSGHSCGPVQDMAVLEFAVPGFVRLDEASTFYNKTRTDPYNLRAMANTTFQGAISVKQTFPVASYSILGNPWTVIPGRSYVVLTANVLTLSQGIIIDTFVVFTFLALLVLGVLGAIWISRRRSQS